MCRFITVPVQLSLWTSCQFAHRDCRNTHTGSLLQPDRQPVQRQKGKVLYLINGAPQNWGEDGLTNLKSTLSIRSFNFRLGGVVKSEVQVSMKSFYFRGG